MTTAKKVARRKLSLLELAEQRQPGLPDNGLLPAAVLRDPAQLPETYGAQGLIDRLPGPKGPHPNRVSEEIEKAILAHSLAYPTHGCLRVAEELALKGIQVMPVGCGASGPVTSF